MNEERDPQAESAPDRGRSDLRGQIQDLIQAPSRLSPRMRRLALWLGGAALAFGVFLKLTTELFEPSRLQGVDDALLALFARSRVDWLNGVAVNITALGSSTLVTLHSAVALVVLLMLRDRLAAAQVVAASVGAGLLTAILKGSIERPRPDLVPRLVEASGFSYPSGHSLAAAAMYLTLAIVTGRHLASLRARLTLVALSGLVIGLIAASRVYLGVHYPSDIASGVSLGVAWALLLAGGLSLVE